MTASRSPVALSERQVFFTGDQHFYHRGIIEHAARPFRDIDEMNLAMVDAWNHTVGILDTVYVLGDFIWHGGSRRDEIISMLNGSIYLIPGDHDKGLLNCHALRVLPPIFHLEYRDKSFVLCHWPLRAWYKQHYGSINLHAHSHGRGIAIANQLDIGVDTHELRPWNYDEVIDIISGGK